MRIISGKWRGRKLIGPCNEKTRPTADRVKESVFNMLQNHVDQAMVLDCFSGTGNLSYEALSRGAKHAYLIEKDYHAKKIIEENCHQLKAEAACTINQGDFFLILLQLSENNQSFDLIFIDPPYGQGLQEKTLDCLGGSNCIHEQTMIVVEHQTKTVLPDCVGKLIKKKTRKYGLTSVTFYTV